MYVWPRSARALSAASSRTRRRLDRRSMHGGSLTKKKFSRTSHASWLCPTSRPRLPTWKPTPFIFGDCLTPGASAPSSFEFRLARRLPCSPNWIPLALRARFVFYAHYDGQPINQKGWLSPPFRPTLRTTPPESREVDPASEAHQLNPEWRLYGRSTGDDKASIQALISAFDALKAFRYSTDCQHQAALRGRGRTRLAALQGDRHPKRHRLASRFTHHGRWPNASIGSAGDQRRQSWHHEL